MSALTCNKTGIKGASLPDWLHNMQNEVLALREQLKEAESVIEFYGDRSSWRYEEINDCEARIITDDLSIPTGWREENGGKLARQYLAKYKTNE